MMDVMSHLDGRDRAPKGLRSPPSGSPGAPRTAPAAATARSIGRNVRYRGGVLEPGGNRVPLNCDGNTHEEQPDTEEQQETTVEPAARVHNQRAQDARPDGDPQHVADHDGRGEGSRC